MMGSPPGPKTTLVGVEITGHQTHTCLNPAADELAARHPQDRHRGNSHSPQGQLPHGRRCDAADRDLHLGASQLSDAVLHARSLRVGESRHGWLITTLGRRCDSVRAAPDPQQYAGPRGGLQPMGFHSRPLGLLSTEGSRAKLSGEHPGGHGGLGSWHGGMVDGVRQHAKGPRPPGDNPRAMWIALETLLGLQKCSNAITPGG